MPLTQPTQPTQGLLPNPGLQKKVGEHVAKAIAQKHHHEAQTKNIAAKFPSALAVIGPTKKSSRVMQKTIHEYEGDPTKVKDVIRSTVIAKDAKQLEDVVAHMSKEKNFHRRKDQHTEEGYKGHIFNYNYPNGVVGEIQANVPHMIYAKEKEKDAKGILGSKLYSQIQKKTGMQSGMGHHHYEKLRNPKSTPEMKVKAAEDSRHYYKEIERRSLAK